MITVILLNDSDFKSIPTLEEFQTWVDCVVKTIPEKIPENCSEICISMIDKESSAELNETYREKKGATNVLSFNYDAMPGVPQNSLGDLAICAEVVREEALAQHKTLESHFAHLTLHGVLHLLGYDHIFDNDAAIMETLETELLKKLHFDNPY